MRVRVLVVDLVREPAIRQRKLDAMEPERNQPAGNPCVDLGVVLLPATKNMASIPQSEHLLPVKREQRSNKKKFLARIAPLRHRLDLSAERLHASATDAGDER